MPLQLLPLTEGRREGEGGEGGGGEGGRGRGGEGGRGSVKLAAIQSHTGSSLASCGSMYFTRKSGIEAAL